MTTVTIVDQRERFRDLIAAALLDEGFTIEWPENVQEWFPKDRAVAIIDLTDSSGRTLLRRLRESGSDMVVLGLVEGSEAQAYAEGLQRGASNVVSKQAHPNVIIDAVHAALTGRVVLPAKVVSELTRAAAAPRPRLAGNDLKLLRLMAAGRPMSKIARELHVSERTLYREASRLARTMGAKTRAETIVKAAQLGLLAEE